MASPYIQRALGAPGPVLTGVCDRIKVGETEAQRVSTMGLGGSAQGSSSSPRLSSQLCLVAGVCACVCMCAHACVLVCTVLGFLCVEACVCMLEYALVWWSMCLVCVCVYVGVPIGVCVSVCVCVRSI